MLALALAALVAVPAALAWTVTMTAETRLTRTHHWKIEKSVSQPTVTLAAGQTTNVTYSVTVSSTGSTDSGWGVFGHVSMGDDPAVNVAWVTVTVQPDALVAPVACVPSPFPVNLGPSGLECDYSSPLPDASGPRDAWMRAQQIDDGNFRNVHTPFDFSSPHVQAVDECVDVTDSMAGALGSVCAADAPKTFTYSKTIGPFAACGEHVVSNTATFLADSGTTGSDDADVTVTVPCAPPPPPPGPNCTYTIGYWKNHAGFGPQADVVTALLPVKLGTAGGAKSLVVTTAAQAVGLLEFGGSNGVKAASNGINKLYAQLLGAKLSGASGASPASIATTIAAADAFLATHDSLDWKGLTKAEQSTVNGWMSTFDSYNNGLVGPAHCS